MSDASKKIITNVISKIDTISVKDFKQGAATKPVDSLQKTSEKDSSKSVDRTSTKEVRTKTTSSGSSDSASTKQRTLLKSTSTKQGDLNTMKANVPRTCEFYSENGFEPNVQVCVDHPINMSGVDLMNYLVVVYTE